MRKRPLARYMGRPSIGVGKSPIIPDKMMVKMKYSSKITLAQSAAGVSVFQFFSGNSLYDPDVTGVGGQPEGYDQWSSFYNRYRVYGSKCRVQFTTVGNTNPLQNYEVVLAPVTINTGYTTPSDARSGPYNKWSLLGLGANLPTLTSYMSTAKIFGQNKVTIKSDAQYTGTTGNIGTGSNPLTQWFWEVLINSVDPLAQGTVYCYVTLTYYAELFDRTDLPQS